MLVYLILLLIMLVGCVLEANREEVIIRGYRVKTKTICFCVILTYTLLLAIFKNKFLSIDSANYYEMFEAFKDANIFDLLKDFQHDIGFWLLIRFIGVFTDDFWLFQTIIISSCLIVVSYVLYKNTSYISLSYLIYFGFGFLSFNFCILRQAIACVICLYSFKYVKEKKLVKFVSAVLFAFFFHKTAIFYLMVYPMIHHNLKIKQYKINIVLVSTSILGAAFVLPMIYKFYIIDYSKIAIRGQGIKLLIFYLVVYAIAYYMRNYSDNKMEEEYRAAFCSVVYQAAVPFFSVFTRVTNYFTPFFAIILPNLLYARKSQKCYYMVAVIFSCMYCYTLLANATNIVPYISIFH